MPRPNRFDPGFAERLIQSQRARGFRTEPQAQEPVITGRIIHQAVAAEAPINWQAMRDAAERFARAHGLSEWLGTFSSRPEELRPEEQMQMYPPSQNPIDLRLARNMSQSMRDIVLQSAADAIRAIRGLIEEFKTRPYVHVRILIHSDVRLEFYHPDTQSQYTMPDTRGAMVEIDNYHTATNLLIHPWVGRYAPVFHELQAVTAMEKYEPTDSFTYATAEDDLDQLVPSELYIHPDSSAGEWITATSDYACRFGTGNLFQMHSTAVRVHRDDPLWRIREKLRLARGEYSPLPTQVLKVLPQSVLDEQIPHMALKPGNAGMIAYTQSAVAGAADRQQVMKAGRYIRQHCGDLSDEDIKQLAAAVTAEFVSDVKLSHDPDDFERVYINGPSSCMAYDASGKEFGKLIVDGKFFHPTRVYAHPDNNIRIAWMEIDGRIVARTLVNVKTNGHSTVYTSDSAGRTARTRFLAALNNLGYSDSNSALFHEKLLRVSPDRYPNAIICPFIDPSNVGVEVYSDHLVVRGEHEANHETGCLHDYNTRSADWHCDCCGEGFDEDDDYVLDFAEDRICTGCADESHTLALCARRGEEFYYPDGSHTFYTDLTPGNRGRYVVTDRGMGDFVHLWEDHYTDDVVNMDYAIYLDDEDEYILEDDAKRFGYAHIDDGWYAISDFAILDGEPVRRDDVPEEAQLNTFATHPDYPDLPVYETVEEEDEAEEAAA